MTNRRKGFTLVELLVVICIIALLMSMLVVLIKGSIDRARNTKSKGLVELLNQACESYRVDFGEYPAPGSTSLHKCLGCPVTMVVAKQSVGADITTVKPPYVEFKRDMLPDSATSTSPNPPQVLVDAWNRDIQYANPGARNTKSVDIWSVGKDTADPADDIANYIRDF